MRPVRMAGHLRNRDMAVRVSDNEVIYLEDVRWAEPLDEAITQLLRQRLRQVAGDAVVTVQVQRCELVRPAGNSVQVTATYTISGGDAASARTGAFTASPRQWDGKDPATLVSLLRDGSRAGRGGRPGRRRSSPGLAGTRRALRPDGPSCGFVGVDNLPGGELPEPGHPKIAFHGRPPSVAWFRLESSA